MGHLKEEGLHHLYINGERVIRQFWGRGLLDEMTISVIPIVLGDGIPLFSPPMTQQTLRLISSWSFAGGVVNLHYDLRSCRVR